MIDTLGAGAPGEKTGRHSRVGVVLLRGDVFHERSGRVALASTGL